MMDRTGIAGAECQRHVGGGRQHEVRRLVVHDIEDRHVVTGVLALPVYRAIRVHGRIAPVTGDQVVKVLLGIVPVAQRDDDVALDTLRPLRLREGQIALGDALGPLAEELVRDAAEIAGQQIGHVLAGLPRLGALHPGVRMALGALEMEFRDRAGRGLAELVAADAAVVLHDVEPIALLHLLGNAELVVRPELIRCRNLQHREPVDRRVVLRRLGLVGRDHRGEIEMLAGFALHLR